MRKVDLNTEYFHWICDLIFDTESPYKKLLKRLHEIDFTYTIPMDDNRAGDGIDLRYRFAYDNNYHPAIIAEELDNKPCSVLEMMAALANRCEEQIADDPQFGDRTKRWFTSMLKSLGLFHLTDMKYDERIVNSVVGKFLRREYKPNGEGGLFTVQHPIRDMRSVEIWYQMCWFLNEVL